MTLLTDPTKERPHSILITQEEVIRQERMASSFVHQTTTEMCAKNKKEDVWAS